MPDATRLKISPVVEYSGLPQHTSYLFLGCPPDQLGQAPGVRRDDMAQQEADH